MYIQTGKQIQKTENLNDANALFYEVGGLV